MIKTKQVQHRGMKIGYVHAVFDGVIAYIIGCSVNKSRFDHYQQPPFCGRVEHRGGLIKTSSHRMRYFLSADPFHRRKQTLSLEFGLLPGVPHPRATSATRDQGMNR